MPEIFYVGCRSRFVTATAWVFMCIGALASVSAALQHAALSSITVAALPWAASLGTDVLAWVALAVLGLSVALFGSALGLLLRLDWARRTFIVLLALAVVANLLGLWLQQTMVQTLVDAALLRQPLPPQAADLFGGFVTAARVMGGIVTVGACVLMVWIIRRLMSAPVRQEFA